MGMRSKMMRVVRISKKKKKNHHARVPRLRLPLLAMHQRAMSEAIVLSNFAGRRKCFELASLLVAKRLFNARILQRRVELLVKCLLSLVQATERSEKHLRVLGGLREHTSTHRGGICQESRFDQQIQGESLNGNQRKRTRKRKDNQRSNMRTFLRS